MSGHEPGLRVFLVDDEPLAIDRLTHLLAAYPDVHVAGSATDPAEAQAALNSSAPDALFLDIHMPGMSGFELLASLSHQPPVVFTTAYDQYALRAFEVNSIDYLLKPIEPEPLARSVARLRRHRDAAKPEWLQRPDVSQLLQQLDAAVRPVSLKERIISRVGDSVHVLELAKVTHFFARDKLTYAAIGEKAYPVDYTINQLEEKLDRRRYARIHRAVIVNLEWVEELNTRFADQVTVTLRNSQRTQLGVSRDRLRDFRDRLEL